MRTHLILVLSIGAMSAACGSDSNTKKSFAAAVCKTDADCASGQTCFSGTCYAETDSGQIPGNGGSGGSDTTGAGGAAAGGASPGSGGTQSIPDGGTIAAGGTATDAAPPRERPTPTGVYCGDKACPVGDNCCYAPGAPQLPGQPATPGTYSCSAGACASTETEAACDGPEDCTGGQICCRVTTGGGIGGSRTTYTCRDTCPAASASIGCAGPQNCTGAQICCETVDGQGAAQKTACAETCGASMEYTICLDDADCPSGGMCNPSTLLSGLRRCY